jgi:hypothetical protein
MAILTATQKREKEGDGGRKRREKGQCTAQKMKVARATSNVRTGGTRRSEGRGYRRAGGRQVIPENEGRKNLLRKLKTRRQRGREETV